jgi:hypothetical protein
MLENQFIPFHAIHSRLRRRRSTISRTAPTYALAATTSGNRIHASVAHSTVGIYPPARVAF